MPEVYADRHRARSRRHPRHAGAAPGGRDRRRPAAAMGGWAPPCPICGPVSGRGF